MSVVLTKSRFTNALKCYWNYALSLFGLVRISHAPMFVSVEPAAVCQLRCPECPVGKGERREAKGERLMPREVWERVLREAAPKAHTMQFYFQGEPLLNKDLPQMIREAHEAGLYTIVSTNAQALTAETAEALIAAGLSKIIVSMDGLSEESYGAYRVGGSVEKVKAGLRYLRETKARLHGRTTIELQCLRLRTNEHEWKAFRQEYKALGADRLVFKSAQLYDYSDGHPLMVSDARYSRYEKGADGKYHRKPRRKGCLRVWSGVVVTTTGEVLPCCYDKAHSHAYGNIMESSLEKLFRNEKALAFRRAALQERPAICQDCWR
jgi:radical SAM protein with 4Fe4S-binding SPASM domain